MATATLLPNSSGLPGQLEIGDKPDFTGGEATVYFTRDGQHVVKLYHRPTGDKVQLLQKVLDLGRNLGEEGQFLAWPLGIVERVNGQPRIGSVSRHVPGGSLYKLMFSPRDARQQFEQGWTWVNYLKIARGVAAAAKVVHDKGIAHADISFKNYLADPRSGQVVLIDLDGVVVSGFLKAQVKGTPQFIAPEIMVGKAKPSQEGDRHSAAVLLLWTLLFRNVMLPQSCYDDEDQANDDLLAYGEHACFSEHPTDRRNWVGNIGAPLYRDGALSFRVLSPRLQQLSLRALVDGLHEPAKRPPLREWERALAEAYDLLIRFLNCRQSYLYPYWLQPAPRRQCPFCGSAVRPPYPAVLELQESRARGVYPPVRTLVAYHGLPLFADVAESGSMPPFTRQGIPTIGQTIWDARLNLYRLTNNADIPWLVIAGGAGQGRVGRGESVPLQPGLVLSFGDGRRLARVVE